MADAIEKNKTTAEGVPMVRLTIDSREITVPKGTTVLLAAKSMGIDIPTFCWHPKLKAVGVCRICYVEIEKIPKLQVSCATEVMEGMVVHTDSDLVKSGRKAILEFTLANHPLDCPTCDKAGECDLQDLTFAHGIDDTRFDFQKARFMEEGSESTFDDVRIGPEIVLNRNRCILCMKCVRANKEAFGEYDLGSYERGNICQINAAPGQQVDNPFSGNLVEICPVGALTNSDWRYQIRVWLTQKVSSVCPFSSSGSNILIYKEQNQQKMFRVTSRCNDQIDDGWLSDYTRYGYQIITSPDRLKRPLVKKEGKQVPVSWNEALDVIEKRLTEIKEKKGRVCIGSLVSPRLDNASLYSASKFIRVSLGSNNIDFRTGYRMLPRETHTSYDVLTSQPFNIGAIETSDVIVTFGTDLLREHPNEYLKIRRARSFHEAAIYSINPYEVKTADVADREVIYNIGTDEILINGICLAAIENGLVDGTDGGALREKINPGSATEAARLCGVDGVHLNDIATALANGRQVTFLVGEIVSRSRNRDQISAALCNLNRLFGISRKGQIAILARFANSRGAEKLGLLPEPSTAIKEKLTALWGVWPDAEPFNTDHMMAHMKKEEINGCLVLGCNPIMIYPDREFARESLEKLDFLVVADLFETDTTALADVVLPMAGWAEYDGQYVNLEGRNQKADRALKPKFESRPASEIVEQIAQRLGKKLFESSQQRDKEIEEILEVDAVMDWPESFIEVKSAAVEVNDEYPVPLVVGDDPHHFGYLTEKAASLVNFSWEAYIEMSPKLAASYQLKAGDSVRVESKVGKIIVPVRISETIKNDVVFIPRNFSATPVTSLLMRKVRVDRVKITKVAS